MKTAKKVFTAILFLVCTMLTSVPAFATDVSPRTVGTNSAYASLSISYSGQASCKIDVISRSPLYRIEVSMSLNRMDGDQPTPIKPWTLSGIGTLSETKTYYVTKGYDYQVIATITIKDSRGNLIESFDRTSAIVHY